MGLSYFLYFAQKSINIHSAPLRQSSVLILILEKCLLLLLYNWPAGPCAHPCSADELLQPRSRSHLSGSTPLALQGWAVSTTWRTLGFLRKITWSAAQKYIGKKWRVEQNRKAKPCFNTKCGPEYYQSLWIVSSYPFPRWHFHCKQSECAMKRQSTCFIPCAAHCRITVVCANQNWQQLRIIEVVLLVQWFPCSF